MKFEERKDELKILFADQFVEKIGSENAYRMMVRRNLQKKGI